MPSVATLEDLAHSGRHLEVLSGDTARQPEVLQARVEPLQRPPITCVLEQIDDQAHEGRAVLPLAAALVHQALDVPFRRHLFGRDELVKRAVEPGRPREGNDSRASFVEQLLAEVGVAAAVARRRRRRRGGRRRRRGGRRRWAGRGRRRQGQKVFELVEVGVRLVLGEVVHPDRVLPVVVLGHGEGGIRVAQHEDDVRQPTVRA